MDLIEADGMNVTPVDYNSVAEILAEAERHFPGDLDLSLLRAEYEPPAEAGSPPA